MSAIAVMAASSDGLAAKKKARSKRPARRPAAAAPREPAPILQPLSEPTPAPVTPAAAPVPADTGPLSIAIIVEGTNARDLDAALKQSLANRVAIAVPSTVRASVSSTDQRIFGRPQRQSDLVKAMKRVGKKAGVDAVVYANVGGSASQGYTAAVLFVHKSGRVFVDGSVPVTRVVKRGGRATLSWQLANVSELVQPGLDDLQAMPRGGQTAPGQQPAQPSGSGGGMSLGDAIANFEAARSGQAPTKPGAAPPVSSASEDNDKAGDDEAAQPARETEVMVIVEEDRGPRVHLFDRRMRAPFIVKVGIEGAHREFAYNQPITANLRDYSVGLAPLAVMELEAYPFANTSVAILKNIGWYATYARAFGVQSSFRTVSSDADVRVNNEWSTWQVGLHSRFRVAKKFAVGPQLTYGFSNYRFEFADIADQRAFEVPDVRYGFLRYGADVRFPFSVLDVAAGLGYRSVFSGGRVTNDYFPNSKTGGIDGHITLGLSLGKSFALDGTVRYVRYFYSMQPEVSDTYVAGGALDQYLTASLSIVYLMGGNDQ
ncbi:MAG: hypothetical protein ACAI38_24010 [Myxococcota bacterium]